MGDRAHPSHWKDDAFGGPYVGIMDPSLRAGQRGLVSRADLVALDLIGYGALTGDPGALVVYDAIYLRGSLYVLAPGISGDIAVEVNGRIVAPPGTADVDAANALLALDGSAETLGLVDGPNVVRLVDGTGRLSNGFAVLVPVIPDAGVQPDRTIALAFDPPGSVPSGRGPSC